MRVPFRLLSRGSESCVRVLFAVVPYSKVEVSGILLDTGLRDSAYREHTEGVLLADHWLRSQSAFSISLRHHHTGTLYSTQLMLLKECVALMDHPNPPLTSSYLAQFWKWPRF